MITKAKFTVNNKEIAIVPNSVEYPLGGSGEDVQIECTYTDGDGLTWKLFGTVKRIELVDS